MAGIYIHIPFCASRCLYCDFFSTTHAEKSDQYAESVLMEMEKRKEELSGDETVKTIYVGGGTPSQMSLDSLRQILEGIYRHFNVCADAEVTMEFNPEDVTQAFAEGLSTLPVNRVSMGIQTFDDERLRFIRRRHTSNKAINAVNLLKEKGFKNISIDLMFGFPGEHLEDWEADIEKALSLDVAHVSAYSFMYEEGTALTRMKESGQVAALDDEEMLAMYTLLINKLEDAGYEHYELSNFSHKGKESKHNMSYWEGVSYLGLGAGAHSYDGERRRWNVNSLEKYMDGVRTGTEYWEEEKLSYADKFNEYVMTRLRTKKGMDVEWLRSEFGGKIDMKEFERTLRQELENGNLVEEGQRLRLSRKGLYISDGVMADLFVGL